MTESSRYSMEIERVRVLEADLARVAQEIQASLDDLQLELEALRARWTGEASTAYDVAQTQWVASMGRMRRLIASASSAAGAGVDRHLEAREQVGALWR